MPAPRKSPITFSLSFTGAETPESSASSHGISRFRRPSSQGTPGSTTTPASGEREKKRASEGSGRRASSSRDSLSRSPSTSLGGQHLVEESTDSSPFANIRVGRSRSDTLAVSSTTAMSSSMLGLSNKTAARSPRSSSSLTSTLPTEATDSEDSMQHTGQTEDFHASSSESLLPATSSSEGALSDNSSTSQEQCMKGSQQDEPMEEEEAQHEDAATLPSPAAEPVPISLDWTSLRGLREELAGGFVMRLAGGEGLAHAPAQLQVVVQQAIQDGATQLLSQLEEARAGQDRPATDLETLEEAVVSRAAATGSVQEQARLHELLQEAIPRAAQVARKRCQSMERDVIKRACAKVQEEIDSMRRRTDELHAKHEGLKALEAREGAALTGIKRARAQHYIATLR